MWRVFNDVKPNKVKQHYYKRSILVNNYYISPCGIVVNTEMLTEDSTKPKCKHCEKILAKGEVK